MAQKKFHMNAIRLRALFFGFSIFFCLALFSNTINPFMTKDTILIMAVGDIMLDRNVRVFQNARAWHYPFYNIAQSLSEADFLTGNLESMISDRGIKMDKKYCFRADISQIKLLSLAGFDCVTVGNNHAFDYGTTAFLDCIDRLEESFIIPVGGGSNITAALNARYFNIKGNIIGVMGLNDTRTNFIGHNKPSTAPSWGPSWVLSNCLRKVHRASERCDIMIVHIHWGMEDTVYANDNQHLIGRSLIDFGADIVIGHHPHRLQPVEFYTSDETGHTGIIVYSLGNFVFDQNDYLNNLSAILRIYVHEGEIVQIKMQPIEMLSSPRATSPAKGKYYEDIFQLIENISAKYGTSVHIDDDSLFLLMPDLPN